MRALVNGQVVALGECSIAVFTDVLLFRTVRLATDLTELADQFRQTAQLRRLCSARTEHGQLLLWLVDRQAVVFVLRLFVER